MAELTSNQLLLGIGLVVALAVGSQLFATVLRLPAIVVLLPAGFVAGILTKDVQPAELLGPLFQPFVSVAVGVILFEAGLRLSVRDITPRIRRVVVRLVMLGSLITWLTVTGAVRWLFGGLGTDVPFLLGAILVVSGPTVVLPLLAFIRPTRDVRAVLKWEGVLIDPLGALLGVLVFQVALTGGASGFHPRELIVNVLVGAAVGAIGAGLLWLLLRRLQRLAPRQVVLATLALVVAALVASDLIRDDSGFVATVMMGAFLANQTAIEVTPAVEFHETLVQLLIGVLFVLIAASVTPHEISSVLGDGLALVAIMILLIRPLAVAVTTLRSDLTGRERAFIGWMAPRGIVAGATASGFGLQLATAGVQGADKILPIVFLVVFATVVVYGLTGLPVARRLGVAGSAGTFVLIVGGHEAARALAAAFKRAGVGVRLWAEPAAHDAAHSAGLEADRGRLLLDSLSRETELEEVTDAVMMSPSDDFNAIAAIDLRGDLGHGHVYEFAPDIDAASLHLPATGVDVLGGEGLTLGEVQRRLAGGGSFELRTAENADHSVRPVGLPLFLVGANGDLYSASTTLSRTPDPGDRVIELVAPGPGGAPRTSPSDREMRPEAE